jgi:hypothetical protein
VHTKEPPWYRKVGSWLSLSFRLSSGLQLLNVLLDKISSSSSFSEFSLIGLTARGIFSWAVFCVKISVLEQGYSCWTEEEGHFCHALMLWFQIFQIRKASYAMSCNYLNFCRKNFTGHFLQDSVGACVPTFKLTGRWLRVVWGKITIFRLFSKNHNFMESPEMYNGI